MESSAEQALTPHRFLQSVTPYGKGEVVGLTKGDLKNIAKIAGVRKLDSSDLIEPLSEAEIKEKAKKSSGMPVMSSLEAAMSGNVRLAESISAQMPPQADRVVEKVVAVVVPPNWKKLDDAKKVELATKLTGEAPADAEAAVAAIESAL